MTFQAVTVLAILLACVVSFMSGRVRVDIIALVALAVLAITGLVTPREALSGFSSPAVVTVGGMFVLSGGLIRTGVAGLLGQRLVRVAGGGELRLVLVVMFTAAILSAFMNNVAVAALLLPVVMDISRSTGISPSRLLMPLAYSTMLGGLTTLIGTPPNILAAEALRDQGMRPFGIFDYTPLGGAVMLVGVVFMALVGRWLLPGSDPAHASEAGAKREEAGDLAELYELRDDLFVVGIEAESPLAGRALAESRFGSALDLNVGLSLGRVGRTWRPPRRRCSGPATGCWSWDSSSGSRSSTADGSWRSRRTVWLSSG
jgi:di/tricarboxylate transporter